MLSFTSPKKKMSYSSDLHKVTRVAAVVPYWHTCSHKRAECIVSCNLQGYHFIRQIVPLFTRTVSRDSRWLSDLRYFSLPWVGVPAFWIGELQLMLRFSLPYLRKVLKFFPSAHSHCTSDFCWWIFVRFGIGASETFVRIYVILPVENVLILYNIQNNS